MKRVIKFRVWDGKKYHYPECTADKTNHYLQFGSNGIFYLHSTEGDLVSSSSDGICEQFTGLADKNGVDIYEGDIFSKVSIDELGNNIDYFYTVKWSSSNQGFRCYRYRLDENENGLYWRKQPSDESLVMVVMYNHIIGNIHQNPELL